LLNKPTKADLEAYIGNVNNPGLAKVGASFYQIWSDGEITLTQGSSKVLPKCRTLSLGCGPIFDMPHSFHNNSYAIVTQEEANKIHTMMRAYLYY